MYQSHWGLKHAPFEARPDSRFLFATAPVEQALATVSYAACEGGEPVALYGQAGCGKTLILRALRRRLPREQYLVSFVPEVALARVNPLQSVAYHLTHTLAPDTPAAMDAILRAAADVDGETGALVVMLDEWPADPDCETLEALRWLLNLDIEQCRTCVLLAGAAQPETQRWPEWLSQRLFATVALGPLTANAIPDYLNHRLATAAETPAANQSEPIFTDEAAQVIAEWSAGVPRLVNRLAHLSMHVAYLELAKRVDAAAVRSAIDRLLPPPTEITVTGAVRAAPAAMGAAS